MTDAQTRTILVGLDGTERSRDALALGHVLGEAVGARLLMTYVHPYGEVSNLLGHESCVREIVDSIFADSHAILPGGTARDMRIVVQRSPAVGLHRLAHEENAERWSSVRRSESESAGSFPAQPTGSRPLRRSRWPSRDRATPAASAAWNSSAARSTDDPRHDQRSNGPLGSLGRLDSRLVRVHGPRHGRPARAIAAG
jgi:hypothetical protein